MSADGAARKFYKQVAVAEHANGFAVTLDGRTLKTPAKRAFAVPTRTLAAACAAEWDGQVEFIRAETMPLTRLCNVALDHTPRARAALAAEVAKFGETDLLSHRAEGPKPLVKRQAAAWDPLLAWSAETLGAPLLADIGVLALPQPPEALAALEGYAARLDDFRLTGLAHAAGLATSAVIACALAAGRLNGAKAFAAAALDDLYQLETWGEDEEARERLDNQRAEYDALEQFFAALD